MTPKARAQEALEDLRKLCLGGWSHSDRLTELQYLLRHVTTIREALALSAALERVPEHCSYRLEYIRSCTTYNFTIFDLQHGGLQYSDYGKTAPAAILAAVEKMEKK